MCDPEGCATVLGAVGGGGHEATDTGLAYAPVSQAHGHHHSVQCFALLHCSADQFRTTPGGPPKGGGGTPPPPMVDPNLGGRRVGGSVGTPTYIPQNDPHDTLIILNMHKWGKKFFKKICPSTQAPISQGPTRRPGQGQNPFLCFSAIFEFSIKF